MDSTIHYKTDQGVNPKSDSMLESLLSSTNIPDMRAPIDTIDIKVSFSKVYGKIVLPCSLKELII